MRTKIQQQISTFVRKQTEKNFSLRKKIDPFSIADDNETQQQQQQQHYNRFLEKKKKSNVVEVDTDSIEFPDDEIDEDRSYIDDDDNSNDNDHENAVPVRWMSILSPDSPLLIPTTNNSDNNNNNNSVDTTISRNGEKFKIWWSGICLNDCIVAESVDTEMESPLLFNLGNKHTSKPLFSRSTILKIRKTLLRSNSTVSSTLHQQQQQQDDELQSTSFSSSSSFNNGWNVVSYAIKRKRTMYGIQFNIYQKKPFTIGSKVVIMDELISKRNLNGISNPSATNEFRVGIVVEYFSKEDKYLIRTIPRNQEQQQHQQRTQSQSLKKPSPRRRTSLSFEEYMSISTSPTSTNSTSKSVSPSSTSSSERTLSLQQRKVDKPILTIVQSEYLRRYDYLTGTIEENHGDNTTESLQKWTFAALYSTTISGEGKPNDTDNDKYRFRVCHFLDVIMGMACTIGFMNPSSYTNTKQSIMIVDEYDNDYTDTSHEDYDNNNNKTKKILSSHDKHLQELMGPILTCQMRKFSSTLSVLDIASLKSSHAEAELQKHQQHQHQHNACFPSNKLYWSAMFTESNYTLLQTTKVAKENRNCTNANYCHLIMDTESDQQQQEPVRSALDILADLSNHQTTSNHYKK